MPLHHGHIMENLTPGSVVDGVSVAAGNDWHGSELDIGLDGKDASDFRWVYHHREHTFILQSTKTLDRESVAVYDLKAVLPGCLVGEVGVRINVLDANDNMPRFINTKDWIEVTEWTLVGSELARVSATDADAGRNGRIAYYASPKCPHVHIVPQTGQVMLVSSFGGVTNLTVRIYAKDNGDVALISAPPVTLHLDVRVPAIRKVRKPRAVPEEMFYSVTVSEDLKVGDVIFTVPDQRFEKKLFEVISEADSPVQIERDSGRLYLAHTLKSPAEVTIKIQNLRGQSWDKVTGDSGNNTVPTCSQR
ncbi:hypothetical protein DPEC_G00352580 [Dallia pectoralis]|uniref:Uncharacterized protein n=1 Tax=Dallia pectoralis TaxID=75939 RepID=A0ACC2F277_DALPE|nr:hypothetical protein DPEC_G00352580 [Dallia pectoralis]